MGERRGWGEERNAKRGIQFDAGCFGLGERTKKSEVSLKCLAYHRISALALS